MFFSPISSFLLRCLSRKDRRLYDKAFDDVDLSGLIAMRTILIAIVSCFLAGVSLSQEVQTPNEFDFDRLANVPVRFNGRLATLDEVAKNYARWFSHGATEFTDADGTEYSALHWYLLLISESDRIRSVPFVHVEEDCRKLLEIPESENRLFTLDRLSSKEVQEKFDLEVERIHGLELDETTPADRSLAELASRFRKIKQLVFSHRSPWQLNAAEIVEEVKQVDYYNELNVPRMIFPDDLDSGRWQVLYRAALTECVAELIEEESLVGDHYAKYWVELLGAIGDSNLEIYKERLQQIEQILDGKLLTSTAFRFTPPADWIEEGVSNPHAQYYYEDACTTGVPMVMMTRAELDNGASITVNHFPGKNVDAFLLCNSWRLSEGLPLLNRQKFESSISPIEKDGQKFWVVDITTSEVVPKEKRRIVARVIDHPGGTWTASLYGDPSFVEDQLEAYNDFVDSMVIPEGVAQWVDADDPDSLGEEGMYVAVKQLGSVDLVVSVMGEPDSVRRLKEKAIEVIQAIEVVEPTQEVTAWEDVIHWNPPTAWELFADATGHQRTYLVENEQRDSLVVLEISVVKSMNREELFELVNHFRVWMGRERVPNEELARSFLRNEAAKTIEVVIE